MHRLAVDVDPIAFVRNSFNDKYPDPIQAVVLAELGGAESIVAYLHDDQKTVKETDIVLLKHIVKTYLNIRCNLTEENVRKLLRVKPDMVTFVAPGELNDIAPHPLNVDMYPTQLQDFIIELRTNGILCSVLIEPQVEQVKLAGKLEFDYIELDASGLATVEDMESEIALLEELDNLAIAANKLGMGVNISGAIGYDNIRDITKMENIEDIIVGKPLFSKSLAIGFEQAVRDLIALM
ncbi:MAG TPA: pyridoxine 5'-phosphate synthase [Caldithrix abyssi]|uniref:Pyridoxine 5'-phosphate synthase n=1 Tax=Caldithrix abyssi TaxID=187145 RepID=A0A7V5H431_CALAY|nr:pyridoxine 5'-phosphate synthase [Caldisericaceae bacterium]HHE55491.1 pyridoxine 5'-phosphate synthase [Caldithrix abyssi]